jgi:uncharacterized membrane protein
VVAANPVLLTVHLLAATVWVGGFVAIGVVGQVARRTLEPAARVAFFRSLGRAYGIVGGASLAVGLGTGAALLSGSYSTAAVRSAVGVAVALVVATVLGVRQARSMTRLRRSALEREGDPGLARTLHRRATAATVLRSAIGLLTLALVVLAAVIAA